MSQVQAPLAFRPVEKGSEDLRRLIRIVNYRKFVMLLGLLLCTFSTATAQPSKGRYHAFRLTPGQDLKIQLTEFLVKNDIKACAIVTCVGSLTKASLRFANEPHGTPIAGPLEIISLVGSGGLGKWHLHLSVSDKRGVVSGGHLMDGSIVRTTAELVIVELENYQFNRIRDAESGYPELEVEIRD